MDQFISFFENLSTGYKLGWIFACLSISWMLEGAVPLVRMSYDKWKHAGVNLLFLTTSLLINVLFGVATIGLILWAQQAQFGLLFLVDLPVWAELLLSVMFLDLVAQWFAHFMLHKISWMWKFHLVHHSDTYVDATTGTRHHPGDYLIREVFSLVAILIMGIPVAYYIFYRILTILFTYYSHANIQLPTGLDRAMSFLVITPNMHKFHHHHERPWTDSNYGNIFSIWDRAFGTFVYGDPHKIRYGVDVLDDQHANNIGYQMQVPFDKRIKTDY